jgi:hypothetical protein
MAAAGAPGATAGATSNTGEAEEANSLEAFLWQVHEYTNEYIRFADTKAAFIAAASTALIGTCISSTILDSSLRKSPCAWYWSQWTAAAGLVLLSVSVLLSLWAIRPRLWNKTPIGFIFWESIGGHTSASAFSQAIHKTTAHVRTNAIAEHLFILASIAKRKYACVNYAMWLGIGGGALTAIALFLQHGLKA